jgi:heme oxygenase
LDRVNTLENILNTDLHGLLRSQTAVLHERLEELPYFGALRDGTLPKPAIVSFLHGISIIHAVLESSLSKVSDPRITALVKLAAPKAELLASDLEKIGAATVPSIAPATQAALDYGAEILTNGSASHSLVGALYVLEGSQNGAAALTRSYAACLCVPNEDLSYFWCYGKETAAHWKMFTAHLNALSLDDKSAKQIVKSATRCFERMTEFCSTLYPYAESDLKYHVTAVNFEAGDHAMPQDPREIDVALRAGKIAWDRFPYLAQRFGERGRRFTGSDSCWLVSLTRMPVESATKSLQWLRVVLATRGLPTIILETHLRVILELLATAVPNEIEMLQERFAPFLLSLNAGLKTFSDPKATSRTIERFDRRFRACDGLTIDSAAQLIASAWMDEQSGIGGALSSVHDWFTDSERFSNDWIATVDEFLSQISHSGGSSC